VVDELIHLGQIGHLRGILERLVEIERTTPAHAEFVAQMRGIVNAFDLKRYVAELEAVRSTYA
jgi:hypothetical protein